MRARVTDVRSALAARLLGVRADYPLLVMDAVTVAGAYVVALVLRFDGTIPAESWAALQGFLPLAVAVYVGMNAAFGLYGHVWRQAGATEARRLALSSLTSAGLLTAVIIADGGPRPLPVSVPLVAGAFASILLAVARFHSRVFARRRNRAETGLARTLVVGPAEAARRLIAQAHADPGSGLLPVAVLDDDPRNWGRHLLSVPVMGPVSTLPQVARLHRAELALLAMPTGSGAEIRRAVDLAHGADLQAKILPSLDETVRGRPDIRDVRDVAIDDLLGREQVNCDVDCLRHVFAGRRVLITGAGGSIGSEIAAQVSALGPAALVLLDNDETHLHDAVACLQGPAVTVLGDIRDETFVHRTFTRYAPEIVFHAAAYKHVPILEGFPCEAINTNVCGTENLLRAAARASTQRFVAISTDKAVNPVSVMGATKRLAEHLVVGLQPPAGAYCAVRFGNVLGSRGSVVPTFVRQIQNGGPVTVTHPDMTRFFMSTREAVHLVMQAAALSRGGEVFVLDMGEPMRILELAERMIELSGASPGKDIRIEFTGLRPGEKLVEELTSYEELAGPTSHPKVRLLRTPQLEPGVLFSAARRLRRLAQDHDDGRAVEMLFSLVRPQPAPLRTIDLTDGEIERPDQARVGSR